MSVNKVIIIGIVGRDPEVKHLDGGRIVSSFSVATDESYTPKGGTKIEATEWHNIVIWGPLNQVVEKYVRKGMKLYLEGKIKTDTFEKDGQKHYSTKIQVDKLEMLSKVEGSQAQSSSLPQSESMRPSGMEEPEPEGNDLPF